MSLTSVFTDIADAIRSKNGSSDTYTPAQMPQAIQDIPTGGEEIDWEAFEADDGKTRFLVDFSNAHSLEIAVNLLNYTTRGTIDWGDGTTSEITGQDLTIYHQYSQQGKYIIEVDTGIAPGQYAPENIMIAGAYAMAHVQAQCIGRNNNSVSNGKVHSYTKRAIWHNANPNANQIGGAFSGRNQHPFLDHLTIKTAGTLTPTQYIMGPWNYLDITLTDPTKSVGVISQLLTDGVLHYPASEGSGGVHSCRFITGIDYSQCPTISAPNVQDCSEITELDLPPSTTQQIHSMGLYANTNLARVNIQGEITTIGSSAFSGDNALQALIFPDITAVPTVSNSNAWTNSNLLPTKTGHGFIYLPDSLVEEAKAATNWTVVADSIKPLSELPAEYQL